MSEHEQRVSGRRVYDGAIVRLDVDNVRLPGGHETVREVIRHDGAVVVVPLTDDGNVVLVRQFRYAVGQSLLELPAGKLDVAGESALECARRELREETGLDADDWRRLTSFFTTPGFTDERIHCYLASGLRTTGEEATTDPDEIIDVQLRPLSEAVTAISTGEIQDAKTIVGILLAAQLETAHGSP
jgi:ADP-ribose pyrophosphatase